MSKFDGYIQNVDAELKEANYGSNDIQSLITCREIINGHLEYLRDVSVMYYEAFKVAECKYKEDKAKIILSAKNPTVGAREAESQDYSLKKDFIAMESKYKKIRSFVESLEGKDDTIKQKISYVKQEEQLNKFLK